jgi:predicted RNA-binding protein with PUA-like domain|tara:strand:- start:2 stop:415 length:414 start_codon:yes stop_codon:yes gene_type:complete
MAYWLIKSEPSKGMWAAIEKKGPKGCFWKRVRNFQARNYMKQMKKGDQCFFYHSVDERQIVGVVEVTKEYYPDETDSSGKFVLVDVKTKKKLKKPVTLKEIKSNPSLSNLALVKQSRLSVMPVDQKSWKIISKSGES